MKQRLFPFFLFFLFSFLIYNPAVQAQFYKNVFTKTPDTKAIFTEKERAEVSSQIREDIKYLCSAKLEGRKTGTYGEQLAGMYIQRRMQDAGLTAYQQTFRHIFRYVSGRKLTPESRLTIDRAFIFIPEDVFPTPFSAQGEDKNFVLPNSTETLSPWIIPLYQSAAEANDPGFDWRAAVYLRAKRAEKRGATSVVFYDAYGSRYAPSYESDAYFEPLQIPVMIMTHKAYEQHIKGMAVMKPYSLTVKFKDEFEKGNNVIGYIDNHAPLSVVIAAHYDHLGRGDQVTSGNVPMEIYNGANDNASGVAAMLALAKKVNGAALTRYNYIFIAFSGEEQEMAGSKAFVANKDFNRRGIAYMLNLDKVGVPNSQNDLFVGGTESSRSWAAALRNIKADFKVIKTPLDDLGSSDYLPFYKDSIPVLYVTTGTYPDHHQPTDDIHKINYPAVTNVVAYTYQLIKAMNERPAPVFGNNEIASVTPPSPAVSSVVTQKPFGITPDTTYKGIGVLIGDLKKGSAAFNAGIKAADIILQIGKHKVNNLSDYQKAVTALKHGAKVTIAVKRGPTVQKFPMIF